MSEAEEHDDASGTAARAPIVWAAVGALVAAAILVPTMLLISRADEPEPADISTYMATHAGPVERRSEDVLDLLVNYDSENFEEVSDEMLGISTGNFRDQYEEIVGTGLGDALSEAGASSEGEILHGPQVTFRTATQAVALAGVEQTTRSADDPEGRTITYLMRLTLVRDGAEWKADRIEILSGEVL